MTGHKLNRIVLTAIVMVMAVLLGYSHSASGVTASDWKAGNIIDDTTFTDKNAMSVESIQAFLDAKVPACDRYGDKTSEYGGIDYNGDGRITRREYAQYRGYGSAYIFTCLDEYYEVPKTVSGPALPANNFGGKPIPIGAKSAAQLIADAAARYSISPKVLLVKLATESAGPLTYDDWPFEKQYTYAMGAHCPDTPDGHQCDPNWGGFSLQIDEAASLMRWYLDSMTQAWWPYKRPYQTNSILWQDVNVQDCGASDVYIETMATAALYTYTPYQPNSAALAKMYGTGDSCSTYGNRNFWRTFSDWFGLNGYGNTEIVISSPITVSRSPAIKGEPVTISYSVQNKGQSSVDTGVIWVCTSIDGVGFGGGSNRKTLSPGETLQVSLQYTPPSSGVLTVSACGNTPYGPGYVAGYPYSISSTDRTRSVAVSPTGIIIVSNGLTSSEASPRVGVPTTLSFTVQNRSAGTVDTGVLWICTSLNGKGYGLGSIRKVLAPNETLVVSTLYTPAETGTLVLTACGNTPNGPGWVSGYPYREYFDHGQRTYTVGS